MHACMHWMQACSHSRPRGARPCMHGMTMGTLATTIACYMRRKHAVLLATPWLRCALCVSRSVGPHARNAALPTHALLHGQIGAHIQRCPPRTGFPLQSIEPKYSASVIRI